VTGANLADQRPNALAQAEPAVVRAVVAGIGEEAGDPSGCLGIGPSHPQQHGMDPRQDGGVAPLAQPLAHGRAGGAEVANGKLAHRKNRNVLITSFTGRRSHPGFAGSPSSRSMILATLLLTVISNMRSHTDQETTYRNASPKIMH
jgi:hypothetical protein